MQYWKPEAEHEFAGDMMPFWDGDQFHLLYLLDRNHHAEQGGLGGHQWAHAASADLIHWQHFPLALPVGEPGSADAHGICTGSIFRHEGVYHAFYATRQKEAAGVSEVMCRAVSRDLILFEKSKDNPICGAPPGYDLGNFRDQFVFQPGGTGVFHMLATASRCGVGVLAHFVSEDLEEWRLQEPFFVGPDAAPPECSEVFVWNDWWYLIYSRNGQMEYKISRSPLGPWQSARRETLEPGSLRVPRTAAFAGGRRLAAGFLPWRENSRDAGNYVYAGSVVFRELIQDPDGTLFTRFVPEMMPAAGPAATRSFENSRLAAVPADCTLSCRIVPEASADEYGLLLRADDRLERGYRLRFVPSERRATLRAWPDAGGEHPAELTDVDGLDRGVEVVVCLSGSVLDVCLNGRRTLIERGFDHQGTNLGRFAEGGGAEFSVSIQCHIMQDT